MEEIYLVELAKHIVRLENEIKIEYVNSGQMNRPKGILLADCMSYCLYLVLDLIDKMDQGRNEEIMDQLMNSEDYCKHAGDRLHAEFFYTLSQLLATKYNITMLRGGAIGRKEFEQSWKRTQQELGI